MAPRLAPALGLAAACAMLTGVALVAIGFGDDGSQPTEIAGAVPVLSVARTMTPSLAARQVTASRTSRATAPPSVTSSAPTGTPGSVSTVADPASTTSAAPATTARSSPPSTSASAGFVGSPPQLHTTTGTAYDSYAQAVFQAINRARAAHHLPALAWSAGLQVSAHRHNLTMARSNTLSHQVDGEPSLGDRETAAGVQWTFAAENIGWTTDRSQAGALDIEARMYAETAPNDAHKRNILTTSASSVGVDVYTDAAHGRLWLTEDFSG